MAEEIPIAITDSTYREPMSDRLKKELEEHSQENLRRAEEKENAMLEATWQNYLKRKARRQRFLNGIKRIFTKERTTNQNSKER